MAVPEQPVPRSAHSQHESGPQTSTWSAEFQLRLPKSIQVINESRQIIGTKEFEEKRNKWAVVSMRPHRDAPAGTAPTRVPRPDLHGLNRRLERMFLNMDSLTYSGLTTSDEVKAYIIYWVHDLDTFSNELQSPTLSVQDQKDMIRGLVNLLVSLNRKLEEAETTSQGIFYKHASSDIDLTFNKLRCFSTLCGKEIEEFEDEREEWKQT
ncbi:hypothetical protein N7492_007676 [Penicillium capsulatum]|uniref:Uncharacterized protein n=1 Tax=Penicillium capsulatum TaxID=69766 RepID=A0A9W9I0C9_9EURO|nr:hypothetical protein N7492_007676 [Penicillium capsulatum]KAJ6117510.1 hypothetical protein N7512_007235 [Penicillium capsulatum]